jgi:hypothetical protein
MAELYWMARETEQGGTAMTRYLVIAARDHSDLYTYLRRQFSGDDSVQVVLDRRYEGRRRQPEQRKPDRRAGDRRSGRGKDTELYYHGLLVVRQLSGIPWRPPWWGPGTSEEPAAPGRQQRVDETRATDDRKRVTGWILEGQRLLTAVPKLLHEHEQIAARADAAERKCARLEEEIRQVRTEAEHLRRERRQTIETLKTLMHQMVESAGGTP